MKKTFATLRDLVAWLESNQGKNIEVCDHADDAGWQSAEDALASYREILDHSSENEEACFADTELEIREVAR